MAGPASYLSPRALLCSAAENSFGPQVDAVCLNGFDFTLLFEESIMAMPLSILVILIVPFRILRLSRQSQKVRGGPLYLAKLVSFAEALGQAEC
jgi:hypothetical protein